MGLDMYLDAKRFLWFNENDLSKNISDNFPELGEVRIKEITAEAAYWRKSNAIHKWFVDNVQNSVDDCGTYDVSREQLTELLELIECILKERGRACELLPTQGGFFFGTTDYDKYYFEDLEDTKNTLTNLLTDKWKGWEFSYHSSW